MTRRATALVEALAKCLEWVEDNGGELVFSTHGNIELADEEGEIVAGVDGFTVENGAELLADLLELAHAPAPAPAVPVTYGAIAEDVHYFGLGQNAFAWDERRIITFTPGRDFQPQALRVPASCHGYVMHQAKMAGADLLTNNEGVPIEFFSELTTAPQILFPAVGPTRPIELDIRAPSCPKAPHPFSGALFGIMTEKK